MSTAESDAAVPAEPTLAADRPAGSMRGQAWLYGLLALSALGLIGHSLLFNFVTDDAFISFVYSRNLAQHGQLVFNLGERVEGYTNFLWTLIIALGLRLGIAAEVSSRVLGTACGLAGMGASAWLFLRLRDGVGSPSTAPAGGAKGEATQPASRAWAAMPALFLAAIPGYACWSSGGLETQLFTALLSAGVGLYLCAGLVAADGTDAAGQAARRRWLPLSGLCLGLSALTRPEGYLFFALLALHLLGSRLLDRLPGRQPADPPPVAARPALLFDGPEWLALLLFLSLTVPHLLFRRWYYGDWVPNTFYVKSSGGAGALTWRQGGYYLFAFVRDLKLVVLPLIYGLGFLRLPATGLARRSYVRLGQITGLLSVVFLLYVASVGGDFMGLYRFVLPLVPLHVVAGALGLYHLLRGRSLALAGPVLAGLSTLHLANTVAIDRWALSFIGADRGIDTPGYLRHYAADRTAIGKWLGQHVQPDDYQVVGGAGAQVYYAGIRALDSFGLCDAYVAKRTPPLSTRPGHQKFAPLDYVLSRRPPPTILTYNVYRIAAAPYQPDPAEAAAWRARGYHFVSVQIPGLSQPWYSFLKRIDRALGPLPPASDAMGSP